MALSKIPILEEYRTGDQDLLESFYKPCLEEATSYDRAVGYFRSTVFLLIGESLLEFAKRGGKMRLVCSPALTEEDYEAIRSGFRNRDNAIAEALLRDLDALLGDDVLRANTEALATLIALDVIRLKIAFRPEGREFTMRSWGYSKTLSEMS